MKQELKHLATALLLVSLAIVIGIFAYAKFTEYKKIADTKKQVNKLARTPMDNRTNGLMTDRDVYGQSLKFQRTADDTSITQTVSSAGPDSVWHTTDDIICEHTDLNKSKLLGQYVGQKSKEFIKGFKNPPSSRFKE